MTMEAGRFQSMTRSWARLRSLQPLPIDLGRLDLLAAASLEELGDPRRVEALIVELGLNDEERSEFPISLQPRLGQGLRIWQYPHQFSRYLTTLARLKVRSYLEVGVRHGGSFVATAEYLRRFAPLDFAIGVDVIPCPALRAYEEMNPAAHFWCVDSRAPDFAARLDTLGPIDLVFIDSHHEEEQCRAEWELFAPRASMIAFHDVDNVGCPGVGKVWQEVSRSPSHRCLTFIEQYEGLGPFMGIGLAIRRERLRPPTPLSESSSHEPMSNERTNGGTR